MNRGFALAEAHPRAWLARLDPRWKLCLLFWISTLSVVFDSPWALAGLFVASAWFVSGLRLRASGWLLVIGLLAAVAWSTLLSQGLFYARQPRTPWFTILEPHTLTGWDLPALAFYREGAVYGLAQSLRVLAVMLCGLAVCLSTSPERLLAALVWFRVPLSIGFTTVTALRSLPLLVDELLTVRQARRMRGYRASWRSRGVLRQELALLVPVLAGALRRAAALATSVTSRGFDPRAGRTTYPPLRMSVVQRASLLLLGLLWCGLLATKLLYWLYLADLYYSPRLRELYDVARHWL